MGGAPNPNPRRPETSLWLLGRIEPHLGALIGWCPCRRVLPEK